ncbi:hypothetical protein [Streptomyces tsukubensis]|uniref:DUF1453 domain-containing protein n=1 Tax=Streptomyces tsukubensis TaxID=83656 RepID=A0A1V4A8H7_9ACTN|nr:hypothetical protein [Streptomyces tsukubensis]OON79244.1 hypothetical protein B1H18_14930 [Streptomyces tsukubensis]QFR94637.1 hypothetical protein GBW32_18265 [Streptomyces tsukubensis]
MSLSDYLLYTGVFIAILATQLGTRRPDARRLLLPVGIVAGVGFKYLKEIPSGSTAHLIEGAGLAVGLLFGLASIALIRVHRDPADHRLVTVAGWPYAALWTAAMALRLGFAYGSTHWFTHALATFSIQHQVPAATYGTAFVFMVLAMITVRTVGVLIRARLAGATVDFGALGIARRFAR